MKKYMRGGVRLLEKNQSHQTEKMRSSNIELFRIITMILIIAHHYVVNSGLTADGGPIMSNPYSWRSIFLLLFGAWGKTGINCFVLITGYFMCKSNITAKKFFKLFFEVVFYNIVIYVIFLCFGLETFSIKTIWSILPISSVYNGFSSCYLVFFLFIPFLNILIKNMNEKQHLALLALCVSIYVLMGSFPLFDVRFNYVTWFMIIYIIGAYIRIYDKKIFNSCKFWGFISLGLFLVAAASIFVMFYVGYVKYYFISDSNKILAVALSVSLFLFFKNLKMKKSKIINAIASTCFGVLLIHANSSAMRNWLWVSFLDNVGVYSSNLLVLHAIGSVLAIFIVCSVIDLLRIHFIEKYFLNWWMKLWNKLIQKVTAKFKKKEVASESCNFEIIDDVEVCENKIDDLKTENESIEPNNDENR